MRLSPASFTPRRRGFAILNFLIRSASVVGLTPSSSAAPFGPDTRQSARLERELDVLALELAQLGVRQQRAYPRSPAAASSWRGRRVRMSLIARSSRSTLPRDRITARSMTFLSSRMLPGQS